MNIKDLKGYEWEKLSKFKHDNSSWASYKKEYERVTWKDSLVYYPRFFWQKIKDYLAIKNGMKAWKKNELSFNVIESSKNFLQLRSISDESKIELANPVLLQIKTIEKSEVNFLIYNRYKNLIFFILLFSLLAFIPFFLNSVIIFSLPTIFTSLFYFLIAFMITGFCFAIPPLLLGQIIEENIFLTGFFILVWPAFVVLQLLQMIGLTEILPHSLILWKIKLDVTRLYVISSAVLFSYTTFIWLLIFFSLDDISEYFHKKALMRNYPLAFITYNLISSIKSIETYSNKSIGYSGDNFLFILRTRRTELEDVASCIEKFLPERFWTMDFNLDSLIKSKFNAIALWIRERNYKLIFNEDESDDSTASKLSGFLYNFIRLDLGKLPSTVSIEFKTSPITFNKKLLVKYLSLIAILFILIIGLDYIPNTGQTWFNTGINAIKITFYIGIITTFVGLIEMFLGKELPGLKQIVENFKTPFGSNK